MANLIETLFAETDPVKIDELIRQIVKEASSDPDTWRQELPAAIAEAERQASNHYHISAYRKQTVYKLMAVGASDDEILKAKADAFDADEIWVKWIAISGDLQELAIAIAKKPQQEYLQ